MSYNTGNLYKTVSKRSFRPGAKGPSPEVGSVMKVASNTKGTGSLAGQPMASKKKKTLSGVKV